MEKSIILAMIMTTKISNIKKHTYEDRFARDFWCKNARYNYISFVKRFNRRQFRRKLKEELRKEN